MGGQCKPATHPTSNRELELKKITVLVFVSAILTPLVQAQNLTCRLSNTETKPLETTVFVTAGPAISYANKRTAQDSYYTINFATIGFSLGKVLRSEHGESLVRGQVEYLTEVEPFWLARLPSQTVTVKQKDPLMYFYIPRKAINYNGMSVTPLLLRYRFTHYRHLIPFVQLGGGLLFTTEKFPQPDTSKINFTPQFGVGVSLMTRHRQAIHLGVNAVHISNAGLGDANSGVNVSVITRIGYTWWH